MILFVTILAVMLQSTVGAKKATKATKYTACGFDKLALVPDTNHELYKRTKKKFKGKQDFETSKCECQRFCEGKGLSFYILKANKKQTKRACTCFNGAIKTLKVGNKNFNCGATSEAPFEEILEVARRLKLQVSGDSSDSSEIRCPERGPIDNVFVIDSSLSINDPKVHGANAKQNFQMFKDFIKRIFDTEDLIADDDNIGLVQFAETVGTISGPGDVPASKIDIDGVNYGEFGYNTNTNAAVNAALEELQDMPQEDWSNDRRVTIVTDGKPECRKDIETNCEPCHDKNWGKINYLLGQTGAKITIYSISDKDGRNSAAKQLACLVDDPTKDIVLIPDYEWFTTVKSDEIMCTREEKLDDDGCCRKIAVTERPTEPPSHMPTMKPSPRPTRSPTKKPTKSPTDGPTPAPVTALPTPAPVTPPTALPTAVPTPKPTQPEWEDGSVCVIGGTCNYCKNMHSYWWGKAFTACGSEPGWKDGAYCLKGTSCRACTNEATWWSVFSWSNQMKFGFYCGNAPVVLEDGAHCLIGSSCNQCKTKHTYWYGKAFTACGNEPKWKDGSVCGIGTTCNACANENTYWWGKAFTACGSEPKWGDATYCLEGTSCKACKNEATWWSNFSWSKQMKFGFYCGNQPKTLEDGATCLLGSSCDACKTKQTYWYSKAITACGNEPKWKDGSVCGIGTTCNACANKQTYWWGKAFTACGSEPKWGDGTLCLKGTSCNSCKNEATWWAHKVGFFCGKAPVVLNDGTLCGIGSTCNNCKNEHSYWWGKAFTACGSEPRWGDGTVCLKGTSCNACKNGSNWWPHKVTFACGQPPAQLSDGVLCGIGTTCNKCKNKYSYWYGKAMTACGQEPCWGGGTFCLLGTSCKRCCHGNTWLSRCK